jgi:hypothetical protein
MLLVIDVSHHTESRSCAWNPEGSKWNPVNTKLLTSGEDYAVWGDGGRWW